MATCSLVQALVEFIHLLLGLLCISVCLIDVGANLAVHALKVVCQGLFMSD